jgi:hypothetical protein
MLSCLAACHMVRAEMSSLMIHTYVRAPAYSIPVPALVRMYLWIVFVG